jgi:RNA methyltransferase, TrmH family
MLSKNKISFINSLQHKKYRDESGLFTAEGTKLIRDLSAGFWCETLIYTEEWLKKNDPVDAGEIIVTEDAALRKIAQHQQSQGVFAVFKKKEPAKLPDLSEELCLMLDNIQDPGNLGTIIRIADWFGIRHIFCSPDTVDQYNPKVIQSTMGALARVNLHYLSLQDFLLSHPELPVYGTFLEGNDIYQEKLDNKGIILMGNEGNGISSETAKLVTRKLLIPNFPADAMTSESLNVAVAAAIVCSEFRRRL